MSVNKEFTDDYNRKGVTGKLARLQNCPILREDWDNENETPRDWIRATRRDKATGPPCNHQYTPRAARRKSSGPFAYQEAQ